MILFIIFTLLFNVVDAKNILTKNKPSHWCNLPTGYVEQSPVRGFNFMKLIPLSKYGKYRGMYFVQVDDEDFEWLNQWNWSVIKRAKGTFYAGRTVWSADGESQEHIKMHRLIMEVSDSKIEVDHEDHNGLNNQRNNLRKATHQQNLFNSKPCGKSKYIGVCWSKKHGKWCATATLNRKKYHLGYFENEEAAAIVRDRRAKELHGEFVRLNLPQSIDKI